MIARRLGFVFDARRRWLGFVVVVLLTPGCGEGQSPPVPPPAGRDAVRRPKVPGKSDPASRIGGFGAIGPVGAARKPADRVKTRMEEGTTHEYIPPTVTVDEIASRVDNFRTWKPKYETNSIGMRLAYIPSGKWVNGALDTEPQRRRTAGHYLRSLDPFLIGVYEVTQEEFEKVMGFNPSKFKDPRNPVESLTREQAIDFCWKLSRKEDRVYRLPTGFQWEFACRAGTTTPFHFGTEISDEEANIDARRPYRSSQAGERRNRTIAVGSFIPNRFGLYDMHGNVFEFTAGMYDPGSTAKPSMADFDPYAVPTEYQYVLRGGSYLWSGAWARSATRYITKPTRAWSIGFRVVVDVRSDGESKESQPVETNSGSQEDADGPPAEAVRKIRELLAEGESRPIPAGKDALTEEKYRTLGWDWYERMYRDHYLRVGRRNPKWDPAALRIIDAFIDGELNGYDAESLKAIVSDGFRVDAAGCDDPLIHFIYRYAMYLRGSSVLPLLRNTIAAMLESDYPPAAVRLGSSICACRFRTDADAANGLPYLKQAARTAVETVAMGDLENVDRRVILRELEAVKAPLMINHQAELVDALRREEGVDPWILNMVAGRHFLDLALAVLESESTEEPAPKPTKKSIALIEQARDRLLRAWLLRPDYPEAAGDLIRVTAVAGGIADETPRFWFDRAVAAQFDLHDAYRNLLWALEPRWGGSHEAMMRFGVECAETDRFDTRVPSFLYDAVNAAGAELPQRTDAFRRPGVFERMRGVLEGDLAAAKSDEERHRLRVRYAGIAYLSGEPEYASKLLDQLPGGLDRGVHEPELKAIGVDYDLFTSTLAGGGAVVDQNGDRELRLVDHSPLFDGYTASVTNDARRVAFASRSGSVTFWDLESGARLAGFKSNAQGGTAIAITPDEKRIASAHRIAPGRPAVINVWNVEEGALHKRLVGHAQAVVEMAFSPDGMLLATSGGSDEQQRTPGEVCLWDVEKGTMIASLKGHASIANNVAFSPDGKILASVSGAPFAYNQRPVAGELILWDVPSGNRIANSTTPDWTTLYAVTFSPDGETVAAAGKSQGYSGEKGSQVFLFDADDLTPREGIFGAPPNICGLAFSTDGTRLAIGCINGAIELFDVKSEKRLANLLGHDGPVARLAFTPDGAELVSAAQDGVVKRWANASSETPTSRFRANLKGFVFNSTRSKPQVTPDGKSIVVGSPRYGLSFWKIDDDSHDVEMLPIEDSTLGAFVISPDGWSVYTSTVSPRGDAVIRHWDLPTKKAVRTLPVEESDGEVGRMFTFAAGGLTISSDGSMLASGATNHSVVIWDVETGERIHVFEGHEKPILTMAFSPDGARLMSSDYGGITNIWTIPGDEGQAPVASEKHVPTPLKIGRIPNLAFSPDGAAFTAERNLMSEIRDLRTHEILIRVKGSSGVLSPDGRFLATGGSQDVNYDVLLWNVDDGKRIRRLPGHALQVRSLVYTPDGRQLISTDKGGNVKVWKIAPPD